MHNHTSRTSPFWPTVAAFGGDCTCRTGELTGESSLVGGDGERGREPETSPAAVAASHVDAGTCCGEVACLRSVCAVAVHGRVAAEVASPAAFMAACAAGGVTGGLVGGLGAKPGQRVGDTGACAPWSRSDEVLPDGFSTSDAS